MKPPVYADPDFAPAESESAKAMLRALQDELAPGERLVWVGQPRHAESMTNALPAGLAKFGMLIGPGVVVVGLILFLVGMLDKPQVMPGVAALGAMLVLGGLALFATGVRASFGHWARRTVYALTDRRVVLREPLPFGNVRVRSFRPGDMSGMSRTERPDGSGDILLESTGQLPNGMNGPIVLARLRRLDGVREVEALVRSTLFGD